MQKESFIKESHFNTEIVNSLKEAGAWAYKIPDVLGTRFTSDKPFDIVGMYGKKGFAIESKQIKSWKAFGSRYLRPSQIENLQLVEDTGNKSFVFLNVRIPANKAENTRRENCLIIFRFKDLMAKRVVKRDVLRMMPRIDGHKKRFDMAWFLSQVRE